MDTIEKIRNAVKNKRRFWRIHASEKLLEYGILRNEIYNIILNGEVIKDYPEDPHNPSCLIFGKLRNEPIHVVCAYNDEDIAIIVTVYKPDLKHFEPDFKTRRK
jgi:hypothetical protein